MEWEWYDCLVGVGMVWLLVGVGMGSNYESEFLTLQINFCRSNISGQQTTNSILILICNVDVFSSLTHARTLKIWNESVFFLQKWHYSHEKTQYG